MKREVACERERERERDEKEVFFGGGYSKINLAHVFKTKSILDIG